MLLFVLKSLLQLYRALRKLKHPSRTKYLRYGMLGVNKLEKDNPTKPLEEIGLSVRTYGCLKRAGIHTLQQLASLSYGELTRIRNLGRHSVEEIIAKLKNYGYDTQKLEKYIKTDKEILIDILNKININILKFPTDIDILADHLLANGVVVPPCKVEDEVME